MIIEHGLIYYIWTDGLKVAELGNNWNNTRKNGMRIKVRSRGELNGKNNLGFDGNHWPGPTRSPYALHAHRMHAEYPLANLDDDVDLE